MDTKTATMRISNLETVTQAVNQDAKIRLGFQHRNSQVSRAKGYVEKEAVRTLKK